MSTTTKELINIIKKTSDQGTKPIDTQAEVIRVEDNTVWVHIPGGIDETPVQKTISAKAGDTVQVRIANGDAWLVGNGSAPPTDDAKAIEAIEYSRVAAIAAEDAQIAAGTAKSAAENAVTMAGRAQQAATDAERDAGIAKESADSALTQLAYVEDVVGVLNWIAEHGDYDPTQDTEVQSGKLYFTRTGSGTEQDPYVYTLVENPTGNPSSQGWYELTGVDEAIANYVSTHLVLLDDGLYIIKDNSGYKLKLTNYGSYIIAPNGTTVVNQNTADGNIIRSLNGTVIAHLGFGEGKAEIGRDEAPYYDLGIRKAGSRIGNYSCVEGATNTASGYISHAEGHNTTASGIGSHAEGDHTTASGYISHAEGYYTIASGSFSHAQNEYTEAKSVGQTAIGRFNDNKTINIFEIGNGTSTSARSNALEVTRDGDVTASGVLSVPKIKVDRGNLNDGKIWTTDKTDFEYPLIGDNGTNLFIGAPVTAAQHHTGRTLISSGFDDVNSKGYDTILISVPNTSNTGASNYSVFHGGYPDRYRIGDSFTSGLIQCAGMIFNSSQDLVFYIPIPKITTGLNATVTYSSNQITARGVKGYLDSTRYLNPSNYTQIVNVRSGGVEVTWRKSTAFANAENATPVTVEGSFTVTFS